jgi:hypothetical protein
VWLLEVKEHDEVSNTYPERDGDAHNRKGSAQTHDLPEHARPVSDPAAGERSHREQENRSSNQESQEDLCAGKRIGARVATGRERDLNGRHGGYARRR